MGKRGKEMGTTIHSRVNGPLLPLGTSFLIAGAQTALTSANETAPKDKIILQSGVPFYHRKWGSYTNFKNLYHAVEPPFLKRDFVVQNGHSRQQKEKQNCYCLSSPLCPAGSLSLPPLLSANEGSGEFMTGKKSALSLRDQ